MNLLNNFVRLLVVSSFVFCPALASYKIGSVTLSNPPQWLTEKMAQKTIDRIENALEWDFRHTDVRFYTSDAEFQSAHGLHPSVLAFAKKSIQQGMADQIAIGPLVTKENFDGIFGHELVHIVVYQKFKKAIPDWLNEGLANYFGKNSKVDYVWLSTQKIDSVEKLSHPFIQPNSNSTSAAKFHYQASQALMELLATKCGSSHDLLSMALGKSVETYLGSLCGITDLKTELKAWVQRKSKTNSPAKKLTG